MKPAARLRLVPSFRIHGTYIHVPTHIDDEDKFEGVNVGDHCIKSLTMGMIYSCGHWQLIARNNLLPVNGIKLILPKPACLLYAGFLVY